MATIPLSWSATAAAPSSSSHSPQHQRSFPAKPPHFSGHPSKSHRFAVSCNQTNDGQNQKHGPEDVPVKLDRRNVLLGMGGLYGAINLVSSNSPAVASPISYPDLTKCTWGTNLNTNIQPFENEQLAHVTVKDTLDNEKMGYVYQEVDLPWLKTRPTPGVKISKVAVTSGAPAAETVFPVKLDKVVKVLVSRPKTSRSKKDKEKEEELLVIEGIEVDTAKFVRFDVFVNDEDDKADELDKAEYAGSFSQVPQKNSINVKTQIRLGLTELLEDLDAEDDEKVLVSLVPKDGGDDISIGGIKIIYA